MDKTKRKAVKGTAYYYDDDSMEFVRQGKGREVQKDVRKHRGSKMYRTVGEKQSSLHCNLSAPEDSTDPWAQMAEDFEKLAQQEQVPLNLKPRGKKILDTESLTVTLNKAQHQMVIVQTISLVEGIDLDDIVWNNAYEIRKCFTGNKKSIQTAILSQGRTSTRS
jgi:hypothetical protein